DADLVQIGAPLTHRLLLAVLADGAPKSICGFSTTRKSQCPVVSTTGATDAHAGWKPLFARPTRRKHDLQSEGRARRVAPHAGVRAAEHRRARAGHSVAVTHGAGPGSHDARGASRSAARGAGVRHEPNRAE